MNMNPVTVTVTDKHTIEAMKQLAPALASKAIEIALAEQATQDQFITADEARALGVGNAEWLGVDNIWRLQNGIMNPMYRVNLKYRAFRKEVPANLEWANVKGVDHDPRYEQVKPAEPSFSGLKKVSTEKLDPAWQKLLHDNLWELYESDKPADPLASLPDELLTPEAKTSLGDWALTAGCDSPFAFSEKDGEYQLRTKAKKSVSWKDMPVGVAVVPLFSPDGVLIYRGCNADLLGCERVNAAKFPVTETYTPKVIKLAPAAQQPWLNWRGGDCPVPDGVIVEVTLRNDTKHVRTGTGLMWSRSLNSSPNYIIEYRVIGFIDNTWELV